jgi:hypothetical protein
MSIFCTSNCTPYVPGQAINVLDIHPSNLCVSTDINPPPLDLRIIITRLLSIPGAIRYDITLHRNNVIFTQYGYTINADNSGGPFESRNNLPMYPRGNVGSQNNQCGISSPNAAISLVTLPKGLGPTIMPSERNIYIADDKYFFHLA